MQKKYSFLVFPILIILGAACTSNKSVQSATTQNATFALTKVFKENTLSLNKEKGFNFTKKYTPTNSYWAIDSFPETVVFQAELSVDNPQEPHQNYQLRIGKGGQIYSFIGSFGESIPPQYRRASKTPDKYGNSWAPWIVEVWQIVAVDSKKNQPPDSTYFIHQAGVYLVTDREHI